MGHLRAQVTPEQRDQVEADLVEYAKTFEPRRLTTLARRIRDQLDPDGPAPQEPMAGACGELRLRDRRDGGLGLEGWLDAEAGAQFRDLIEQLAQPRPASENIPAQRSIPQRRADALAELCGLARSAPDAPATAGEPPHLSVTLDLEALRAAVGAATPGLRPAVVRRPGQAPGLRLQAHPGGARGTVGAVGRGAGPAQCPAGAADRVEFIPPAILDPHRRPLVNSFWR
jgi:hypothetical protein